MIALVNICCSVLFIFLFLFALEDVNELWWDRLLCLALSIAIYMRGFSEKASAKKYILSINLLFYLQTAFLIFAAGRNDYSTFYFMSLFLVQQSYVYCLRTNREVYYYLSYSFLLIVFSLCLLSNLSSKNLTLFVFSCFLISMVMTLAAVVKSRFLNDMNMNQGLLKTLVSKADMAVFLTDDTGIITDSNTRATELFGYEREELLGKDFKLLRKYYLSEQEILNAYEELDKNKFWNAITVLMTKSGHELNVRISVAPVMNGSRRVLIYRVIDITAMKQNEAMLIEAKEKAEDAVKSKGQFLAMMSHEIRTPLNGVIATASMLAKTHLDNEQMEYVDTVRKSGQSLLMLINDILDFSKMESGKMALDVLPNKPEEIIYEVTDLLRPYAEEKGIRLNVNIRDRSNSESLMLDGLRLKQVLLNLLGNALKFTDKGSVTIECEKVGSMHDVQAIRYTIKDTGIGIPEDKLHLLFQSFSQVDSSTSRRYGGTGLGLAISQQIVEMMGGVIGVESMEGQGTTFSFVLSHPVAGEFVSPTPEKEIIASEFDFSNLNILVADDNEINRQVFKYMLNGFQIESDTAVNGFEVLEWCSNKKYDIIFMDMQMPGMDGLEATRRIRNEHKHQPMVVAVTANAYADDREKCIESGMNDFLSKPFDLSQLSELMGRLMARKTPGVDSAA